MTELEQAKKVIEKHARLVEHITGAIGFSPTIAHNDPTNIILKISIAEDADKQLALREVNRIFPNGTIDGFKFFISQMITLTNNDSFDLFSGAD